jgi:hypothetical protein
MGVGNATVTAKIGPGLSLTTAAINGLTSLYYDYVNQVVKLFLGTQEMVIDVSANTTFTQTFSGGVYTITIS